MGDSILIVDDEVHICMLLEQTLEELCEARGLELLRATDGDRGLELIRERRPAVVFLDVMMPKKNGYDVCAEVRADPDLAGVKIVLLTAKGQSVDKRLGLESGALLYLTKPFDPDDIVKAAQGLLDAPARP